MPTRNPTHKKGDTVRNDRIKTTIGFGLNKNEPNIARKENIDKKVNQSGIYQAPLFIYFLSCSRNCFIFFILPYWPNNFLTFFVFFFNKR